MELFVARPSWPTSYICIKIAKALHCLSSMWSAGKVDFGPGTGRKAFFDFLVPAILSPCMAFLEKGGDWYRDTFFLSLVWDIENHFVQYQPQVILRGLH